MSSPARSAGAVRSARPAAVIGSVLAVCVLLLAGCGSAGRESASGAASDSINYALPANFTPNWILPIGSPGKLNTNNSSITGSLWEHLVSYDGATGTVGWHKDSSIARDVHFNDSGTAVTITLGHRHWSDGKPITSRDVEFWYNLITANKKQWGSYNEGQAPDNWTRFRALDDHRFTIDFDRPYNTDWMMANQLSLITPLPQHAWDKTSVDGPVGDHDRTGVGAKAVWKFLNKAGEDIAGYASDPLWKVVSGPYRLKSFSTAGNVILQANPKYDGKDRAQISTVNLLPFTTPQAEENAVRSGQVDYGYISPTMMDVKKSFEDQGFQVKRWTGWAITYMPYNFNNPTMGSVFRQLYARQAIQHAIDQEGLLKAIFHGAASVGYGPVPQESESKFLSDGQRRNPYPYDVSTARRLLADHGWSTGSDGILSCRKPGSGSQQCGRGVKKGTRFSVTVQAQSGSSVTDNQMSALQAEFKQVGIEFKIKSAPVNTVLSQTPSCSTGDAACSWQLSYFGSAGSWYFPAYPTGDSLFQTGGSANFGSYSDPEADKLIKATTRSTDSNVIKTYGARLARQLPVVWLPEPDYQVSVIRNGLQAPQDPLGNFHPSRWAWQ